MPLSAGARRHHESFRVSRRHADEFFLDRLTDLLPQGVVIAVVIPLLVQRGNTASEADGHGPLLVAARAEGMCLERVPDGEASGSALPSIVRTWRPAAHRAEYAARHGFSSRCCPECAHPRRSEPALSRAVPEHE